MSREKTPWYYYLIIGAMVLALLFALVEVNFNVANSFLGKNGAAAPWPWTLLELAFLALGAFVLWAGNRSRDGVQNGHYIAAFVCTCLAVCAGAGFVFNFA